MTSKYYLKRRILGKDRCTPKQLGGTEENINNQKPMNFFSSVGAFCLLLLYFSRVRGQLEGFDDEESSVLFPTPSQSPEPSLREPVLTGDAIANIVCSGVAIIFLTGLLCYTSYTFSKKERKTRTRTALENNKLIDKQIAAAKARAEQGISEKPLLVESSTAQTQAASSSVADLRDNIEMSKQEAGEENLPVSVEIETTTIKLHQDNT